MRMPQLLADFIHNRVCELKCEKFLTRPNPQELCSSGHSIDIEMLSLRSFLIHEAEYRIVRVSVNKNHGGDLKQHLTQVR